MNDVVQKYNTELYHVGVKGMKWGVRKKGFTSNGSSKRPGWQRKPSKWEQGYIDRNGINPGSSKAPMGAKNLVENSRSASIKKGAKAAGKVLGTVGLMGITAAAGTAGSVYLGYRVLKLMIEG